MKKTLMYFVAMFAFATVAGAQGWFRQPTPNDTLRSTVILPDNSVVFQIYAPEAESVAVAGDLPWDKPVRRMHVWTPAGYEKTAEKLPVLYLVHGARTSTTSHSVCSNNSILEVYEDQ